MTDFNLYPFAAVVGQDEVKEALLIALANPKTGGVLIAGESGTAKSTLVRSLSELTTEQKLITLPLNATEEMIFGSLDLEYALTEGKRRFAPGIMAKADGQLLYIDEINLLRRELTSELLDIAVSGVNLVEREGISHRHTARFTLIGTMNPAEGDLTASLLDRFGLYVTVKRDEDAKSRQEIIRRILDYEADPKSFCQSFQAQTDELALRLKVAQKNAADIKVAPAMMQLAASLCNQACSAGHRGELFLLEAAKSLAGLAGRNYLLPGDLEKAARYVLAHRFRQADEPPIEPQPPQTEQEAPEQEDRTQADDSQTQPQNEQEASPPDVNGASHESDATERDDASESEEKDESEQTAAIDKSVSLPELSFPNSRDRQARQGNGKRSLTRSDNRQGRYVRGEICHGKVNDIAFDATLRAAAPYQRLRPKGKCAITLDKDDLRQKVREKRIGNTFLFVVDASGSMGARQRMGAVKGAIFALLQDAYQKRDRVGMIAFRRQSAEILLPITRSVDLAQRSLQALPTGGRTPLAEGLHTAYRLVQGLGKKEREMRPILVLVTDGRANGSSEAIAEALKAAGQIGKAEIQSIVIDTETDFLKLAVARDIAREMGADYYGLTELSEQNIVKLVRERGARTDKRSI